MTLEEAQPKNKLDVFDIGIYVVEIAVIGAIVYAMIAFPMWLKPVTS
jgi:hypothetical protein